MHWTCWSLFIIFTTETVEQPNILLMFFLIFSKESYTDKLDNVFLSSNFKF